MRRATKKRESVWIVQHDETPDNTVLGVFATPEEAQEYAETAQCNYPNGVITTEFPIGLRFGDGAVRYRR